MPKSVQIPREEIVRVGFEITTKHGIESATATAIAKKLKCSIQPIYYAFTNMNNLQDAIIEKASHFYAGFLREDVSGQPRIASVSWNYFRFAREYPHLFRLIFINARQSVRENIKTALMKNKRYAIAQIQKAYNLDETRAEDVYIKIGLLCQGIAFGIITGTAALSNDEYARHITEVLSKFI